ncbi:MAG: diguanylate cyclase [Pseudomonadota bacterium]
MTLDLPGKWYQSSADWSYQQQSELAGAGLTPVPQLSPTGGRFWYQADFKIIRSDTYVLDFKNSSTIGRFRHTLFNAQGLLIAEFEGGIQSLAENPFFLRHGRALDLAEGDYRLISKLDSPFFLAQPQPYLDTLRDYQQAIKPGNALVLMGLGVFLSLGFYYAALAVVRRRMTERMYAFFILGNLLYNGTALLVFPDLLNWHWVYLVSVPVLFSNMAYIVFVNALLDLRRDRHPSLHSAGRFLLGLFAGFILLALIYPNWSLELDRYGVGLLMTYGLVAGIVRARQGDDSAKLYLVANGAFFVVGLFAISLSHMDSHTLYVEHIGLLAVVLEVFLLALVLSYQFSVLNNEKQNAIDEARRSRLIAKTDALTGLPNRFHLDVELAQLPPHGSLTIIDLDGLKHYNDTHGHQRGDELLCAFAHQLKCLLSEQAVLHRMGGDEFAVTCHCGNSGLIERRVAETIQLLRESGFEAIGASCGSGLVQDYPDKVRLKQVADERMYQQKKLHKRRATDGGQDGPASVTPEREV